MKKRNGLCILSSQLYWHLVLECATSMTRSFIFSCTGFHEGRLAKIFAITSAGSFQVQNISKRQSPKIRSLYSDICFPIGSQVGCCERFCKYVFYSWFLMPEDLWTVVVYREVERCERFCDFDRSAERQRTKGGQTDFINRCENGRPVVHCGH